MSFKQKVSNIFLVIGWVILVVTLIIALVLWLKFKSVTDHLAFAFGKLENLPLWLPISNTGPILPTGMPSLYDANVANYLLDQMSRKLHFYMGDSGDFECRPGISILHKVYTEHGKELSCLILEDNMSESVIIIFKGTTTKAQMKTNLQINTTSTSNSQCQAGTDMCDSDVLVHEGFKVLYSSMHTSILDALSRTQYKPTYVVGHSLGGAMTNLCMYNLFKTKTRNATEMYGLTIGSPRIGNRKFAEYFSINNLRLFQLRNTGDVFPTTPWMKTPSIKGKKKLFEYVHAGQGLAFYSHSTNMMYAHSLITYQQNLNPSGLTPVFER